MSEIQSPVQPTQENEAPQNREPGRMRRFLGKIRSMAESGDIKIMGFKDRVVDTVKGWHERGATASWSQQQRESAIGQFADTRGAHAATMMDTFRSARTGAKENVVNIAKNTADLAVNTVKTVANPVTALTEKGLQGAAKVVKVAEDAVLTSGGALRTAGDNLATLGYRGATRIMDSMGGDPTEAPRTKLQQEMRKRSEKFGGAGGAESPVVMALKQQNDLLMLEMQAMQEQMKQMMDMLKQGQGGEAIPQQAPEQPLAPAAEMHVEPVDVISEPTDDEATIDVTPDEAVPQIELAQSVSEEPAALASEEPMANGTTAANETQIGQPTVQFEATNAPKASEFPLDNEHWQRVFRIATSPSTTDQIWARHLLSVLDETDTYKANSEDLKKIKAEKSKMLEFGGYEVFDDESKKVAYEKLKDLVFRKTAQLDERNKNRDKDIYKASVLVNALPQLKAYLKTITGAS